MSFWDQAQPIRGSLTSVNWPTMVSLNDRATTPILNKTFHEDNKTSIARNYCIAAISDMEPRYTPLKHAACTIPVLTMDP